MTRAHVDPVALAAWTAANRAAIDHYRFEQGRGRRLHICDVCGHGYRVAWGLKQHLCGGTGGRS